MIEFGHNDGGSLSTDNGRTDCPGQASEVCYSVYDGVNVSFLFPSCPLVLYVQPDLAPLVRQEVTTSYVRYTSLEILTDLYKGNDLHVPGVSREGLETIPGQGRQGDPQHCDTKQPLGDWRLHVESQPLRVLPLVSLSALSHDAVVPVMSPSTLPRLTLSVLQVRRPGPRRAISWRLLRLARRLFCSARKQARGHRHRFVFSQ